MLRRLVDEPDALARVASRALRICHFDPVTGQDEHAAESAPEERCAHACYDCLLSYGNQGNHLLVDRHSTRDLLLALARSTVRRTDARPTDPWPALTGAATGRTADFLAWLREGRYRCPDELAATVHHAVHGARPDLVYRLTTGPVAVFVDGGKDHADGGKDSAGDGTADDAEDDTDDELRDLGWTVVRVGDYADHGRSLPERVRRTGEQGRSVTEFQVGSLVKARGRDWVVLPGVGPGAAPGPSARRGCRRDRRHSHRRRGRHPGNLPASDAGRRRQRDPRGAAADGVAGGVPRPRPARSARSPASRSNLAPTSLCRCSWRCARTPSGCSIADDVGIGKTVEAGLIAAELLAQGTRARPGRALRTGAGRAVAGRAGRRSSASTRSWCCSSTVQRLERGLFDDESIFDRYPCTVVSTDFIKSPKHRDDFVRACPDLVIVDEAHTCVADGSGTAGGAHAALRAAAQAGRRPAAPPRAGDGHAAQRQGRRLPQSRRPARPGPGHGGPHHGGRPRPACPAPRAAPPRRHPALPGRGHAVPVRPAHQGGAVPPQRRLPRAVQRRARLRPGDRARARRHPGAAAGALLVGAGAAAGARVLAPGGRRDAAHPGQDGRRRHRRRGRRHRAGDGARPCRGRGRRIGGRAARRRRPARRRRDGGAAPAARLRPARRQPRRRRRTPNSPPPTAAVLQVCSPTATTRWSSAASSTPPNTSRDHLRDGAGQSGHCGLRDRDAAAGRPGSPHRRTAPANQAGTCWWPPTACPKASTSRSTSRPSCTTTWRGTRPATSSGRAGSTGSGRPRTRSAR